MKKRSPITVFLLSIVTLGIYDLYWLVVTKKVLNEKTQHKTPTIWLLILPFPLLVAGYAILIINSTSTNTHTYQGSLYNSASSNSTVAHPSMVLLGFALTFIGFFASFILSAFWFYRFSKAVNEYTQGKMNTSVTFLILWLIHLIGVALIQDTFNEVDANGHGSGQAIAPNPVPYSPNAHNESPSNDHPPVQEASNHVPNDHVTSHPGEHDDAPKES